MKNFIKKILIMVVCVLCAIGSEAQNTTSRIGSSGSTTGGSLTFAYASKAYASTLALTPNAYQTTYKVASLTGAMTVTMSVVNGFAGDQVQMTFVADTLTAGRVVTFGTGTKNAGTLTVDASQRAGIRFVFDGTYWVEVGRAKE